MLFSHPGFRCGVPTGRWLPPGPQAPAHLQLQLDGRHVPWLLHGKLHWRGEFGRTGKSLRMESPLRFEEGLASLNSWKNVAVNSSRQGQPNDTLVDTWYFTEWTSGLNEYERIKEVHYSLKQLQFCVGSLKKSFPTVFQINIKITEIVLDIFTYLSSLLLLFLHIAYIYIAASVVCIQALSHRHTRDMICDSLHTLILSWHRLILA